MAAPAPRIQVLPPLGSTIQEQSTSDNRSFPPIIDHSRREAVAVADYELYESQVGRTLYRGPESPLQWAQVNATLSFDATTFAKLGAPGSLKLVAGAGAGTQAIARKFTQLAADQFVSTFPLVILECWFKPFDANLRDVQVFVRPDDTVRKYQAALRFWNQQASVSQQAVQYLDNTGTFQTVDTYAVRPAAGSVGDAWHHLMVGFNYLQGASGYLTYQFAKFDDFTWHPATPPAAQQIATGSFRETSVDLVVSNDSGAAATQVNWDQVLLCDLSNAFQL